MATANPAINDDLFRRAEMAPAATGVMTIQGAVGKTVILVIILLAVAGFAWTQAEAGVIGYGLLMAGLIGGFVIAMVTIFYPKASPITAPLYAVCEGLLLGAISAVFESAHSGIVLQAISLTVGVLLILLLLYGTRIIRATENVKTGIIAATGAIFLVYMVDLILRFFGKDVPFIHESGWMGIGFSLLVVVIASMNLILDFDFIERGAAAGAPKYLEWYGGFALLVTLVWMYLEILRLLGKLSGSRD